MISMQAPLQQANPASVAQQLVPPQHSHELGQHARESSPHTEAGEQQISSATQT
jgi:hypothetical protein